MREACSGIMCQVDVIAEAVFAEKTGTVQAVLVGVNGTSFKVVVKLFWLYVFRV